MPTAAEGLTHGLSRLSAAVPVDVWCKSSMLQDCAASWGDRRPSRRDTEGEPGTPDCSRADKRDEQTDAGLLGWPRCSPSRATSAAYRWTARRPQRRRRRRRRGQGRSARRPGRGRDRGQEAGAGAARGARHRDADRQRRDQGAGRQRDHRRAFRATARASSRATCCSRSTAARSRRRSSRSRRVIAGAEAQLEQAERDVARYTELVAKNATTLVTLNNAQTQVNVSRALAEVQQGDARRTCKVQLELHHHPRADHRPHQHGQGQGRQFRAPGRHRAARDHQPDRADLRDVRGAAAVAAGSAQGARRRDRDASRRSCRASNARAPGQVTMIENTVDAATGMVMVRATMPNKDELLWPGTLVQHAADAARGRSGGRFRRRRCRSARPAPSCSWSRTASAKVRPVKVERTRRRRDGASRSGSRAARRRGHRRPAAADQRHQGRDPRAASAGILT